MLDLKTKNKTKDMVLNGLLVGMVFVATFFINIRLPISINGGLIHMGTAMLVTISILFGKKKGLIAGAFGMALFDLMSGWAAWMPFTFVIRGAMGYTIGYFAHAKGRKGKRLTWNMVGIILGSIIMIVGYYMTEGILYGNWITPLTSIPGNLVQIVMGILIGVPVAIALKKTKFLDF